MYSLNDSIEIAGEWWDSTRPEMRVAGQLSFKRDEGIDLRINQAFDPPQGAVRPGDKNPQYDCVHGVTVKGEAVTLIDAQQLGASLNFSSGGMRRPGRIHARILVMGAHLPPQFKFLKMSCRVPGLQVWLAQQLISHQYHFDVEDKVTRQDYCLKKMPMEEFDVPIISSAISIGYGVSSKVNQYYSADLSATAWISITPHQHQDMDWFLEQKEKLIILLSFLSGQVFIVGEIQAKIDNSNHKVSILFSGKDTEAPKQKNPSDFFMSRASISVPFSECVKKWFEVTPKVEKSAYLGRSVMASKDLWLHMEFLSLIQVLEGFHRATYDGNYMETSQYEDVCKELHSSIPSGVSSDHRAALKSRIQYGNQYALRRRLKELQEQLTETTRLHIFGPDKSIPGSWIDTRNYYTHWDEELKDNILDEQAMYYANVRLQHFANILFRLLVGVPASDCEAAFSGSSDSAQQLIQLNIIEKRATDPSFVPHAIMTITSGNYVSDGGPSENNHTNDGSSDDDVS